MEAAKDLLLHGKALGYPKSMGWPVILAVVFAIFGVSNLVAINTSAIFGLLTPINIFLIGSEVFKNKGVGLFAAAIFSI